MSYKNLLKHFLWLIVNFCVAVFLLISIFIVTKGIIVTLPMATRAPLNNSNLIPEPLEYIWQLNIENAPLDLNKIQVFTDYYEYYSKVLHAQDAYGLLGYFYCLLGKENIAEKYLKKAIEQNPYYFYNFYNLAMLYISQHKYKDAQELLNISTQLNSEAALITIKAAKNVYLHLLPKHIEESMTKLDHHFHELYSRNISLLILIHEAQERRKEQEVFKTFKPEFYAF